ncbi:SDR family NAD(P)-dependent oxidoreductase [Amycolatopsis sp. NPDC059657]|uniref:SDR family NAD(P)-dependent oxidoreductase n=1 Tax=Amycolatopsis sp. NPDC059657 TaxID=3346899 RepID=UPI00366EF2F1
MNLRGKSVLITGATGGLGQAIARRLRAEGAELILTGRRAEVLKGLADEIGGRVIAADLADAADVERLARETGDVDIVIANAALPGGGVLESYTTDEIDRALDINLRAPIVLTRVFGEPMLARGSGHIVFISSLSGKVAAPASSLYSATKFGLRGFALGLREDWNPRGVGVSSVNPGFIRDAGMFADGGAQLPPGVGTRTPEDVAAAVVRAIRDNKAEIDVAPPALKASTLFATIAPQTAARVARRLGSDRIAHQMAEGQRHNR